MTQIWDDQNRAIAVTVVRVTPVRVVQLKTPDRDGYSAVQVTYGIRKARHAQQARGRPLRQGATSTPAGGWSSCGSTTPASYSVGQELTVGPARRAGDKVDVTAVSKGKGFAGGMKRHNFKGQGASHGNHKHHRAPGSVGACATPARVFKGTRMAGQMGNEQGHHPQPRGRPGRRRAQPAADQGRRARAPGRHGPHPRRDQGRQVMALVPSTCATSDGDATGSVTLDEAIFGIQPNVPGPAPGRDRPAGRRPGRDPEHQDPGRGVRRRQEAVQAEGHRPGPPGLGAGAALHRRWRRPRPQAPQLPPAHPAQDDPAGPALGAVRPGRPRAGSWSSSRGLGRRRAPRRPRPPSGALGLDGQGPGRADPRRRGGLQVVPQPARHPADPGRRAQRLRHPVQRLDRLHPRDPARRTTSTVEPRPPSRAADGPAAAETPVDATAEPTRPSRRAESTEAGGRRRWRTQPTTPTKRDATTTRRRR